MDNTERIYKKFFIIKVIILIILISFFLFNVSCPKSKKVYKIGILNGLNFFAPSIDTFKEKMTELGYVEGENITYELKSTDFDMAKYKQYAEELIELKPDLLFVFPTEAAIVIKEAAKNTDIPIVFNASFIEDTGLVNSIQEPGGNITGVRYPGPDIAAKRFEIIMQIDQSIKTVLIPYIKGYPSLPAQLAAVRTLADSMGVKIIEAAVESPPELATNLKQNAKSIDAIMTLSEPLSVTPDFFKIYGKFALDNKVVLGGALFVVDDYGTLYGVNMDIGKSGKDCAIIVNKIFNGTKAGKIPVISADNYIEIDYKRAVRLGYNIPDSVIKQADKVYR